MDLAQYTNASKYVKNLKYLSMFKAVGLGMSPPSISELKKAVLRVIQFDDLWLVFSSKFCKKAIDARPPKFDLSAKSPAYVDCKA